MPGRLHQEILYSEVINLKLHFFLVNSVCWAPEAFGLMLACGSSDGAVSIVSSEGQ